MSSEPLSRTAGFDSQVRTMPSGRGHRTARSLHPRPRQITQQSCAQEKPRQRDQPFAGGLIGDVALGERHQNRQQQSVQRDQNFHCLHRQVIAAFLHQQPVFGHDFFGMAHARKLSNLTIPHKTKTTKKL